MHSLQHTWQHCATKSYLKQTFHCERCIVVLYPHVEQLSEPHGWGYVAYNLGKTDTQQLGTMSRYSCDPAMTQPQGQQSHDSMFTNMRRTYVHTCFPGCTAQGHGDIDSITFCHWCWYDAIVVCGRRANTSHTTQCFMSIISQIMLLDLFQLLVTRHYLNL